MSRNVEVNVGGVNSLNMPGNASLHSNLEFNNTVKLENQNSQRVVINEDVTGYVPVDPSSGQATPSQLSDMALAIQT